MTHQINPAPHGKRRRCGGEHGRMAGDSEQRLEEQGQPSGGEPFLIGVSGGTASGKVRGVGGEAPLGPGKLCGAASPAPGAAAAWQRGGSERPPRHVRRSAAGPLSRGGRWGCGWSRGQGRGWSRAGSLAARGRMTKRRERGRRGLCPGGGRSPADTWRRLRGGRGIYSFLLSDRDLVSLCVTGERGPVGGGGQWAELGAAWSKGGPSSAGV